MHVDFYAAGPAASTTSELSEQDERLLRRAIDVATRSVANGNLPFGGLLADPEGNVLLEAENSDITGKSPLNHAETNLMRMAVETLSPEQIATATLYTSCEPCAMCSGSMYWGGLHRLVYGMSEHHLLEYTGANPAEPDDARGGLPRDSQQRPAAHRGERTTPHRRSLGDPPGLLEFLTSRSNRCGLCRTSRPDVEGFGPPIRGPLI